MNKSLNHCIYSPINKNELEYVAVNIESSLIKNQEYYINKTISAKIFEKTIQSNQNKINSKENKTLELLKYKIRDNDLQIIKSDKRNTVCILDNKIYTKKKPRTVFF